MNVGKRKKYVLQATLDSTLKKKNKPGRNKYFLRKIYIITNDTELMRN